MNKILKIAMISIAFVFVVVVVASINSEAADIVVDINGGGDFLTLGAALDDAGTTDGDVIYIWDGNYVTETKNRYVNDEVTIIGNGTENVTLANFPIRIYASNVTMGGFSTDNSHIIASFSPHKYNTILHNLSIANDVDSGIDFNRATNVTLENITIEDDSIIFLTANAPFTYLNNTLLKDINSTEGGLVNLVGGGVGINNLIIRDSYLETDSRRQTALSLLYVNEAYIHNTTLVDWVVGITIVGDNNLVENVTVINNNETYWFEGSTGVHVFDSNDITIQYCTVYDSIGHGINITTSDIGLLKYNNVFNATNYSVYQSTNIQIIDDMAEGLKIDDSSVVSNNEVLQLTFIEIINTTTIENMTIELTLDNVTTSGNLEASNSTFLSEDRTIDYDFDFDSGNFNNCTFNTTILDNSTTSNYTNCVFRNDDIDTFKYINLTGTTIIHNSYLNETLVISTNTTTITNTTFYDQILDRSAYTNIYINSTPVRASNSTFFGGVNSLRIFNTTGYIEDCTLEASLLSCLIYTDSNVYMNRTSITNDETGMLLHGENGALRAFDATLNGGRVSLNRATAYFNRSDLSSLDIQATSADIHIYNSSLRSLDYYLEDSNITGYNTRLSRDDANFYFYSTITQKWFLQINTNPNTNVEVRGVNYTSDANGDLDMWVQQWTWDNDQFNDTTAIAVKIGNLTTKYYYVSNVTWINLTEEQNQIRYDLRAGWNLLGISVETNETANGLLRQLGYGSKIYTRDGGDFLLREFVTSGTYRGHDDFTLETGVAYYIYTLNSAPIIFNTTELEKNSTRYSGGWNLMTIPENIQITYSEFFTQNPSVSMIYQRDPYGEYTLYQRSDIAEIQMVPSNGYYIFLNGDGADWFWKTGGTSQ